jgi:dihydrofolate reductase
MIPLTIVVAVADNGVIGRDNGLVWRLKTDLRRFRALTLDRPMILGRRTWDSIGGPLPGRRTIVLTRDPDFRAEGAAVVHDWAAARAKATELAGSADAAAVAGGAEIYRLALPEAARLHLTLVHASPEGDVRFPAFDRAAFRETLRQDHRAGPDDEHPFTFVDLVRRAKGERGERKD